MLYLLIINIIAIILFAIDKYFASHNLWRVSEIVLHTLELLGGVFGILLIMPIVRHKVKKPRYYVVTVCILIIWCFVLYWMLNS